MARQMAEAVTLVCALVTLTLTLTSAQRYEFNEMECPNKLDPEIFASKYWIAPGDPFRAWKTLPESLFIIKPSIIPGAGMGVFTKTFIAKHTWLGEYEGDFMNLEQGDAEDRDHEYTWRLYTADEVTHYVDAMPEHLSNWLRFINCPRHVAEESVIMHTCYGRVYYRVSRDLAPGTEMFIYYGNDYALTRLNILPHVYNDMQYAEMFTRRPRQRYRKLTITKQCVNVYRTSG